MFTGIIEEKGIVKSIVNTDLGINLTVCAKQIFDDLKIGDSVSINGCCQTVTEINNDTFTVQAVFETLKLTNFKDLKINSSVNLERAITLNSRLGGHIVSGHVDTTGQIISIKNLGNSTIFEISLPESIKKYLIYKGSITVNGVSLTISELKQNSFCISVIPHTLNNTTFAEIKTGDVVNLEPDIIAKYIEKFVIKEDNIKSNITLDFLKENGF